MIHYSLWGGWNGRILKNKGTITDHRKLKISEISFTHGISVNLQNFIETCVIKYFKSCIQLLRNNINSCL